jgi:hypothetical protein
MLTVEPSGVRIHSRSRGGEAINFWEIPSGPVVVHCCGAAFWSALRKTCREVSPGGHAAISASEERLLAHVRTANLDRNEATCRIRDDARRLEGDAVAKPPPTLGGPRRRRRGRHPFAALDRVRYGVNGLVARPHTGGRRSFCKYHQQKSAISCRKNGSASA